MNTISKDSSMSPTIIALVDQLNAIITAANNLTSEIVTTVDNTGTDSQIPSAKSVYTLFENTTGITIISGTPANAVAMAETLTITSGTPADGSTVKVGGKTYTFKTTLTPTEGEVKINGSLSAALTNLKAAINHTGTPGTDYSCSAANANVAAGTLTGTTLVCTWNVKGVIGNSDSPTTNVTNGSWATTITGVNGTVGSLTTIYLDTSYLYVTSGNTISQSNWYRLATSNSF